MSVELRPEAMPSTTARGPGEASLEASAAEATPLDRPGRRIPHWWLTAVACLFLASHLPFLARVPGDIDSVNFVLGVRDFDVARHQPHPPGYPILVLLGKASTPVFRGWSVGSAGAASAAPETPALAFWSALLGALAVFPLFQFFRSLEQNDRLAAIAAILTMASPLYWFTAIRPLSDVPGLAMTLVSIALIATALQRQRAALAHAIRQPAASRPLGSRGEWQVVPPPNHPRSPVLPLVTGALVSGLVMGLRSQAAWLTLPLLALALFQRGNRRGGLWIATIVAFIVGVLAWAVPLLVVSGGPARYVGIVRSQAQEDLGGVLLLVTHPTPRQLMFALLDTFVLPWDQLMLAIVFLGLALLGGLVMLLTSRYGLLMVLAVVVPYMLFHLLFHETSTTRYALPIIPAIAYLAVRAIDAVAHRFTAGIAAGLALISIALALPETVLFAERGSPLFQAFADLSVQARRQPSASRPVLAMHYGAAIALRSETLPLPALPSRPKIESRELVRYWKQGGAAPIWFVAETRRTDLALVDPASRKRLGSYRWPVRAAVYMGGARPGEIDWYELRDPGWFAAQGWALTPEVAGSLESDRTSATVYVRRRPGPVVMMLGGRNLSRAGQHETKIIVSVDGRPVDTWAVPHGFFLRTSIMPAGVLSGAGRHALLEVSSDTPARGSPAGLLLEQFDLQAVADVVYGFGDGWHEQEYDPLTGRVWRWSSDRAETIVHHAGRDLMLRLAGDSPLGYFDAPPRLVIRAGLQVLAHAAPSAEFELRIRVPADALDRAEGRIILETDRVFVPAERGRSPDRRRLGLKIYTFELTPVS